MRPAEAEVHGRCDCKLHASTPWATVILQSNTPIAIAWRSEIILSFRRFHE